MEKKDILQMAQEEGKAYDERELSTLHRSFSFGMLVVVILCALFSVIKAIQGESFYEFGVILFTYLGAIHFHQFFYLRINKLLFAGITCIVGSIANLIGYLLLG